MATVGSLVVLAILIAPVGGLRLGQPEAVARSASAPAEARAGLDALVSSGLGPGVLRPTEILAPASAVVPAPPGASSATPAAWSNGTERVIDHSSRGPAWSRMTGRRVVDTATLISGTSRPARPMLRRNGTGVNASAARLTVTVIPEKTTELPAVAAATMTASRLDRPAARSSRQRVTTSSA